MKAKLKFAILACFLLFHGTLAAQVIYVASDNIVEVNPNTSVTVTTNLSDSWWTILPQADAYINVWNDDFDVATTNMRLVAGGEYLLRMDGKFVLLGEGITGNIIFQYNGDRLGKLQGQSLDKIMLAPNFTIYQVSVTTTATDFEFPFIPKYIEVYAVDDDISIGNVTSTLFDFDDGYIVSQNIQRQLPFVPRAVKVQAMDTTTTVNFTICR